METNNDVQTNQTTEDKKPLGVLFGSIEYMKKEDIDSFIDTLTPEQAKYCLIQALNYATNRGVYSMLETEVISKSLRLTS